MDGWIPEICKIVELLMISLPIDWTETVVITRGMLISYRWSYEGETKTGSLKS